MKKVALLSISLMMAVAGFAQIPAKQSEAFKQSVDAKVMPAKDGTEIAPMSMLPEQSLPRTNGSRYYGTDYEWDEWTTMTTYYDLQSNSALGNRMAIWNDGTVSIVETFDHTNATFAKRGTGYNYFNGEEFGEEPTKRVETVKSGWPTITAWGQGEILASHTGEVINVYRRATKGEGEWEQVSQIEKRSWPRIITSGDGNIVHMVCAEQVKNEQTGLNENFAYYYRSEDGGATWTYDVNNDANKWFDGTYFNHNVGADDYVLASNGNMVAIMLGAINCDICYLWSEDNGLTWEKKNIIRVPYAQDEETGIMFDWSWNKTWNTDKDSTYWEDNSHAIAIADDGTVHVAFGLMRWAPSKETAGAYSYWPMTYGIVYWNSNYKNPVDGTSRIPYYGEWERDLDTFAGPVYNQNGKNGIGSTLVNERVDYLAYEDGYENLFYFGRYWDVDENGDTVWYNKNNVWDNRGGSYRSLGIYTMPTIVLGPNDDIYIGYNALSKKRIGTGSGGQFWLNDAAVTYRKDGVWYDDEINFTGSFEHELDEAYYMTAAPRAVKGYAYWAYNCDDYIGIYLDYDSEEQEGQAQISENYLTVVRYAIEEGAAVAEVNPINEVSIYPNPANANGGININSAMATEAQINFHNIAGQLVKTVNKDLTAGVNTIAINDLNSGVYFCTINANGYNKTVKLVVK